MKPVIPIQSARIALSLALFTPTIGCFTVSEIRQDWHDHVIATALDVETANGSVTVTRGGSDQVRVDADVKARSQERLDATQVMTERKHDGTLSIWVDWPDGRRLSSEGCSFVISVPDVEGVRIRSSNGTLSIDGLSGHADLKTSNGRIEASKHDGTITARTSNGRITLQTVDGDVRAESSNGRIEIYGGTGKVHADTSNGGIRIDLDDEAMGPVWARTSNGSIDVDAGSSFRGDVVLKTSNGSCRVDGEGKVHNLSTRRSEATFSVGDTSGESSTIRSSNGSVTFRVRRSL